MKRSTWLAIGLVIAEAIFSHASIEQGRAQPNGTWYYCDPAHAYYPYVSSCPVPWREVAPQATPSAPAFTGSSVSTTSADNDPCTNPNLPFWQMPAWAVGNPMWRQSVLQGQNEKRAECDLQAQQKREAEEQQQKAAQKQVAAQATHQRVIAEGEELGYRTISNFDDFTLDGKALAAEDAQIQMSGYYKKNGESERLYASQIDAYQETSESIPLMTDGASRPLRAYFLRCGAATASPLGCQITVRGHVQMCHYLNALLANHPPFPCLNVEDGVSS